MVLTQHHHHHYNPLKNNQKTDYTKSKTLVLKPKQSMYQRTLNKLCYPHIIYLQSQGKKTQKQKPYARNVNLYTQILGDRNQHVKMAPKHDSFK